jgi:hypothetical protein
MHAFCNCSLPWIPGYREAEKVLASKEFTGKQVFTFNQHSVFCLGKPVSFMAGELGHCFC